MAQSKIEFRLGDMHFIGEGERAWVTKQLDKIISKAPALLRASEYKMTGGAEPLEFERATSRSKTLSSTTNKGKKNPVKPEPAIAGNTVSANDLASFIRAKKAASNQRAKFLATAAWLVSKGKGSFITRDITKAIDEAQLPKLANASVNLTQNLKQGYLVKAGKEFRLSPKARKAF